MEHISKIFVTDVDNEEVMKISFNYGSATFPEREFVFLRFKEEKLEVALTRIKSKISAATVKRKKKKPVDNAVINAEDADLEINVIRNGKILSGSFRNIDAWVEGTQLTIGKKIYHVYKNAPQVSFLSLPSNILTGFLVYPKVCLEFSVKEDSIFMWYRHITKDERLLYDSDTVIICKQGESWLKVGEGFFYISSESDIGHKLKIVCIPKCGNRRGKQVEVVSISEVELGPLKYPYQDRHFYTKTLTESGSYRCISYNILADLYADSDTARNELFPYCSQEVLNLDYRKQLYIKEILGYNGDILCLQEVDHKVFQHDLVPVLSTVSLDGVFNEKGGQVVEGLACFFRSTKFRLCHSEAIILSDAVKLEPIFQNILNKISENEKLKKRVLKRTTALQVVLLECLDAPKKQILVGNTHLYFRPKCGNVRLLQAAMCMKYLENLLKTLREKDSSVTISLMLNGDFNSCPKNSVFQLMTQGLVSEECTDWKSNPEEEVPGMLLQHSLTLDSACGTPKYTNYTQGFSGCIDYIFYDKEHFNVTDVVPLPSLEQVTEYVALPSKVFPSDHLALVCTLQWK